MIVTAIYYPCLRRVICALTADHTLTLHSTALLGISHISYHILLEKMKIQLGDVPLGPPCDLKNIVLNLKNVFFEMLPRS